MLGLLPTCNDIKKSTAADSVTASSRDPEPGRCYCQHFLAFFTLSICANKLLSLFDLFSCIYSFTTFIISHAFSRILYSTTLEPCLVWPMKALLLLAAAVPAFAAGYYGSAPNSTVTVGKTTTRTATTVILTTVKPGPVTSDAVPVCDASGCPLGGKMTPVQSLQDVANVIHSLQYLIFQRHRDTFRDTQPDKFNH